MSRPLILPATGIRILPAAEEYVASSRRLALPRIIYIANAKLCWDGPMTQLWRAIGLIPVTW